MAPHLGQALQLFFLIISIFCCVATTAGLVQPWWVLWFLPKQNRLLVLRYYFLPGVVALGVWLLLQV